MYCDPIEPHHWPSIKEAEVLYQILLQKIGHMHLLASRC
jgi:hypothetical protein